MTEPAPFTQLQNLSAAFTGLVAKVAPGIVSVHSRRSRSSHRRQRRTGAMVMSVDPQGPGAATGVYQGDIIVGVPKITNYLNSATAAGAPDQVIIGKMYVQFQIPTKHRQWPLVMVHGSGYTGSALDATPDGREGWLPYSVQNNLSTFVVDQAGRGRSGFVMNA
jgi:hypothetical protein